MSSVVCHSLPQGAVIREVRGGTKMESGGVSHQSMPYNCLKLIRRLISPALLVCSPARPSLKVKLVLLPGAWLFPCQNLGQMVGGRVILKDALIKWITKIYIYIKKKKKDNTVEFPCKRVHNGALL